MIQLVEVTVSRDGSGTDGFCLGPLNIRLASGEILLVAGGNGSGKSTLAQLLSGWHPELLHGTVTGNGNVLGQPLSGIPLAQRAAIVQLVQQNPLAQLSGCAFSVEEEIAFGPENLGLPEADIRERLESSLTALDCAHLRHRQPATLSGGEAQRVVLAAAVAMRPKLLLLDEAFSRLTPEATLQFLRYFEGLCQQTRMGLVVLERLVMPAARFASHMLVLHDGKITATGTPESCLAAAQEAGGIVPSGITGGHILC